jgi:hypothetical protein
MNSLLSKQSLLLSLSLFDARAFSPSTLIARPSFDKLHRLQSRKNQLQRVISTRGGSLYSQDITMDAAAGISAGEKLGRMKDVMKNCGVDGQFSVITCLFIVLLVQNFVTHHSHHYNIALFCSIHNPIR